MVGYYGHKSRFYVCQKAEDRALESKHQVYLRTCRVMERGEGYTAPPRELATGLHYLDAIRLKQALEAAPDRAAEVVAGFVPTLANSGYASGSEYLTVRARLGWGGMMKLPG